MNDMRSTVIPRSDQLNADDLLTGPITIKIAAVSIKAGQEQPVSISYENDSGKPYKACKSMCRVMVALWGADASKYVGRSMTLYCDPKVRWGGMEVGGIRISHMSDIAESTTMALTVSRANKKPFTVKPLKAASGAASPKAAQTQMSDTARSEDCSRGNSNTDPATSASAAAPMSDDAIGKEIGKMVKARDFDTALDLAGSLQDEARRLRAKETIIKELDKGAA